MSSVPSPRLSVLVLASSLTLNAVLVSCGNEPTAPQGQTSEILAKLEAMTERLDSIESKLGQHSETITTRIDTLESRVTIAVGTDNAPAALQVARVDSLMNLASYIARDISSGGWELCGGVKLAAEGGSETAGEVEGKALGSLGAWAGLGGFAGAKIKMKRDFKLGVGIEGEFGLGGCVPVFAGDAPPARLTQSGRMARLSADDLHNSLTNVANQAGLTEAKVTTALGVIGTTLQSPASLNVQDAISLLPLPPSLAGNLSDPVGTLSSELPARITEAVNMLCSGSWGPSVSAALATACARISSGSTDIGGLFQMVDDFPAVQTALSSVSSKVGNICSRVNSIGLRSLSIPNPLSIGPSPFYGPERLFPSYTSISC